MSLPGDGARPSERVVAFHSLPTAALFLRGDRIVAVNAAYVRLMGTPAETIVGRAVPDLIGELVVEDDASLVRTAEAARKSGQVEGQLWIRVIDVTGRPRSVRVDWRPSGEPDESIVYVVDAEGEATARAAAEGLARAAGQLGRCRDEREVLERAADILNARGLIVTTLLLRDGDPLLEYGPMRSLSAGSAQASAASKEVRGSRPKRELLWELNKDFHLRRATFFQDVRPLIAAAYPGPLGDRIQSQVPQRRTVQAPLFVNDAPYGALVLTGDDLSPSLAGAIEMFAELLARAIENVRLRTELVQRERLAALGEAAAVMAHEVRNPVASILNAGSLLQKDALAGADQAALLQVIGEEALRLDRLVSDLLELGRPLAPRLRSVDLYDLARRSVGVLAGRGQASDIEVVVVKPDVQVLAEIDPDLAQLALWNVVRNAVQASLAGQRVTVRTEMRGDRAALVVDDDGKGFPADGADRLLEPFQTTRATGTGIGLAVVRRVVEACRGSIEIASSPSGGGRFVMLFPGLA
jgi:two-component system, NtrC family, sensor histidine kinase HydH